MLVVLEGYKVVHLHNYPTFNSEQSYSSAIVNSLFYTKDNWTVPDYDCGPIAVFEDYQSAYDFIHNCDHFLIFKCLYIPSDGTTLWLGKNVYNREKSILPAGTIFADAVKLIKCVDPYTRWKEGE